MLNENQLLLLDNLIYLKHVANQEYKTVGEIVNNLLYGTDSNGVNYLDSSINPDKIGTVDEFPGRMTRAEWVEILDFIEADTELCSYTLTNGVGEDSDGLRAACFVNGNDVNVVFRATGGDDEWHDNGQGGYLSDTQCQIEALDYFNSLNLNSSHDITVTGHSKGGNKSQYITILSDIVDRCVSFDGQGFSREFIQKYSTAIAANASKIVSINAEADFINCLLFPIASSITYVDTEVQTDFMQNHCPNIMLDENGNIHSATDQDVLSVFINDFTTFVASEMPMQTKIAVFDATIGWLEALDSFDNFCERIGTIDHGDELIKFVVLYMGQQYMGYQSGLNNEVLFGYNGNIILGSNNAEIIDGTLINDIINGFDGNDYISGGVGDDYICSGNDDDIIYGQTGNDHIFGENGDDIIDGGSGNDILSGNDGNDTINGNIDDDTIYGGDGEDILNGGDGDDYIAGGFGNDELYGGGGNDTLHGGYGDKTLNGGDGNDIIYSGSGTNLISAGSGDDIIIFGDDPLEINFIDGGSGNDTYIYVGGGYQTEITNHDTDLTHISELKMNKYYLNEVIYNNVDNDLQIGFVNSEDTIILKDYFDANNIGITDPNNKIDSIYFSNDPLLDSSDDIVFNADVRILDDCDNSILTLGGDYTTGGEIIVAKGGNDTIDIDSDGIDLLYGGDGSDILRGGTRDDVLHGQEGNDFLYGEDGDDILYGGNGNDQLIDYEGNNSLFGGDGDDVLDVTGSAGHNYLEGEGGSDQIYGGIGNSSIYGGDGNDLLDASLSLGNNTLSGENGDDTIYGGSGNDVLYSGAGDDTLYGGAGNDELYSGNGNDVLYGGDGDDALIVGNTCGNTILDGGDGDDDFYAISTVGYIEFYGGNGNDVINAGIGDQRLYGGSGDDIMFAGSGNQYLYGDSGNDNMFASDGVQLLDGGDDDDEIHADGTTGNSTFIGGAGNDYIMGGAGTQTIDGGTGNDELWAGYGLQNIIGGEGNDTIHSYDNYNKHTIDGGDGDDLIYVSNGYINGGNGFDTIHLYSSGTVNGGSGNDTITLYSAGMVDGGDGDDIIISSGGFGGKVDGGNGNDSITAYAATDQSLAICGGSDDDVIELYGDGFSVEGGDGNDVIRECWASHDSNILEGGAGDDIIFTFSGSSMDGGTGNDTLNGSIGEDAYIFNLGYGADTIIDYDETAGNIDSIWFGEGILPSDIKITRVNNDMCITIIGQTDTLTIKNYYDYWDFDLDYAIEQFQFEDGTVWDQTYINAQTIYIYGSDTADEIYGVWENNHIVYAGADDDEIFLGDGLNIVYGEAGDDIICTYAGNDQLYGGDGDDYLDANCGDDYLDGGTGNDTYIFEHGYGTDTIIDQDNSSDNIDTIEFGYDIIPEDIIISRAGQNMEITIAGQTDKLIIQSYYESDSYKVERFVFRDGTIWDSNAISQQPVHIAGTEASETITGDYDAPYNEILDGKGGNDTLKGYMGNDTYIFGIGYGVDTIKDEDITAGNIDTIRFGDGIDPSDITINRVGSNMEITVAGQTDKLIIQSFFSYEDNSFKIERFEFSDSTVWDAETIRMQPIYRTGTAGSERISGNDSNVYNEIFDGKGGDDILKGSTGNDTYIFNLGYGTNTIYDIDATTGNIDTIRFGEGISAADIRINQVGSDMEITINGQSDKLIIDDYFYNDSYKVERFEFSDGTVWDANTIKQQSVYVTGTGSGETLVGNDDTPYNEILDGKGGNDTLKGYMGNDTYIFGIGYGVDTIKDEDITAGNIDTIRFGEGIDASDITINRVGSNMEITVAGQTDKLIIQSFFSYGDNSFKIERFEFSDSTVWDAEAIRMQPIYRTGTAGSETISGNDSNVYNEIFDGKGGDDVLKGSTGNDTYIFGVGYGSDRIYDIDSTLGNTDKIEYADSALSLIFSRTYDDLVISNAETNDILTVKAWYSGSLNQVEEIHDNTGLVILNTQIEQLIQEMAAFEQQNNISWSDAVEQCPNDVQSILSQFWVAS